MSNQTLAADPAASGSPRPIDAPEAAVILRRPRASDGPAVTALIAASPPLDANSAYCNLVQCTHFADTCVVAERNGAVIGWISAHRPPAAMDQIFVWQVAVDPSARGTGLGGRMLDALVKRPAIKGARFLTTTVTEANTASWALFGAFARRHGLRTTKTPLFERDAHFAGAHETEWQAMIGPLPDAGSPSTDNQEETTKEAI
jgi:L-2,4-diaminobutyric acid acetyltransferase